MLTSRGQERIDPHWHEPERDICFDNVRYSHEGFFAMDEFRTLIRTWATEFDYITDELVHQESVTEHGRELKAWLLFQKKMSEQHFAILRMEYHFTHVRDQRVTIDGRDRELQHGHVHIAFNGYVMGFERFGWEGNPVYAFLHGVVDKFVYKLHRGRYATEVIRTGKALANRVKGFFDLYKQKLADQIDTAAEKAKVQPELKKKPAAGDEEIHMDFHPFEPGGTGMP